MASTTCELYRWGFSVFGSFFDGPVLRSVAGGLFAAGQARLLSAALLRYMLDMKHNGAVENVQAGFVALAARWAAHALRQSAQSRN